jgi:formaldehyde-activating enzyme involved in methanogenesis
MLINDTLNAECCILYLFVVAQTDRKLYRYTVYYAMQQIERTLKERPKADTLKNN